MQFFLSFGDPQAAVNVAETEERRCLRIRELVGPGRSAGFVGSGAKALVLPVECSSAARNTRSNISNLHKLWAQKTCWNISMI